MAALGLLLMLAAAAMTADAVVQNTGKIHAIAFNQGVDGLTLGGAFVAGAVVALVFAFGLALLMTGVGRRARLRRQRRAAAAEAAALRTRNGELETQLDSRTAYPADSEATAGDTAVVSGPRHRR